MKAEERAIRLSIPDEKYNMPVEQLDLSVRTMNCLRRSNITTVGELIGKGTKELLKLRNFGQKSYQEIEDRLSAIGLSLNPKTEEKSEEEEEETKPRGRGKKKKTEEEEEEAGEE
jgi:DNA-directed RNA polymerase subunit alpha